MDPANPIDEWIRTLDETQVKSRLDDIDRAVESLEAERSLLNQALDLKHRWAVRGDKRLAADDEDIDTSRPMLPVPEAHLGLDGPAPTGKSDAALRVLASRPDRDWAAKDVAAEVVRLGWMEDTARDHDSLASTLSRLAKDRRIHRPRRGVYRLAPPEDRRRLAV
jgi:hypothetical protein